MQEQTIEKMIEHIETAFNINLPPEDYPYVSLEGFKGKHWNEINLQLVLRHNFSICSEFSAEAFRFYLPALMILTLSENDDDIPLKSMIIWGHGGLAPPNENSNISNTMEWFNRRTSLFTDQEVQAINLFLGTYKKRFPNHSWSYVHKHGEALDSAIAYWKEEAKRRTA